MFLLYTYECTAAKTIALQKVSCCLHLSSLNIHYIESVLNTSCRYYLVHILCHI